MPGTLRQKVLVAFLALVVAFSAGWKVQGWRLTIKHEKYRREQAEALNEARDLVDRLESLYRNKVATIDARYTKELKDAQAENDRLRADLQRGAIRLSIPAKCPATSVPGNPGTTGSTNATSRADIDERAAAEILTLTERGDKAIRQLSALQEYVRSVCIGGE
ncbi:lysis protein [Microbulbifer sp. HZ11]|uniref:lysis protein n=1 Tax=Microbulbifer sp. HZ11 TaxID=1453501 RepID=UPI00068FC558|nr:lysis protein [Microbulbifer sp. HZ11]